MIPILSGLATACIIMIANIFLFKHVSAKLVASTILCSIAFIYVGFSLLGNTPHSAIIEIMSALVFYCISIAGYSKNDMLIAYGILLHGTWDVLHHETMVINTVIPHYYPIYCFVVDIILGIYFIFHFRRNNKYQIQY
jgi:hypothetical protein